MMDIYQIFLVFRFAFSKIKKTFDSKKVQGELIRDAGLASLVNFLYTNEKDLATYALAIVSVFGIIIGVILKEGDNNGQCNN